LLLTGGKGQHTLNFQNKKKKSKRTLPKGGALSRDSVPFLEVVEARRGWRGNQLRRKKRKRYHKREQGGRKKARPGEKTSLKE